MSYEWLGADYKHARFSPDIEKAHPWVSYTAPYKDALYAIVTLSFKGTIVIEGIKSEWIRPSPSDLGAPEKSGGHPSVPWISNRVLKAN